MKHSIYWNTFTNTGKVEDYLKYKDEEKESIDKTGDQSYAGFGNDNGNDHKNSAYRGIR